MARIRIIEDANMLDATGKVFDADVDEDGWAYTLDGYWYLPDEFEIEEYEDDKHSS